jgi:hypothetical protein
MPKTAVALFEDPKIAEDVMREIEAIGFPRNEVRVLEEPEKFEVTGAMSFPRLDFETDLERALSRIGASDAERQAYLEGLHHGGALVLATDSGEKADAAAKIMNQHGGTHVEETSGEEPELPRVVHEEAAHSREHRVMTGRMVQPQHGVALFTW